MGFLLGQEVSRYCYVDYTAGGDVGREENGWEFNLGFCQFQYFGIGEGECTSLLSWVRRTATPASTLPTVNETSIVEYRGCVVFVAD